MLLHSKTRQLLDGFINQPRSSVIIEGSRYSGRQRCVEWLARQLLQTSHKNNIITLSPVEGKTLGVEKIRDLKRWLTTTVSGDSIGRVAVIDQAETMTTEAQNALLKLLEEPTDNTVIVLATRNASQLLSTIHSRCQHIKVLPIPKVMAEEYAREQGASDIESAYLLSGGEAELFVALLNDEHSEVTLQIDTAKGFLKATVFERLSEQKTYAAQGEDLDSLLQGLHKICEGALHKAGRPSVVRWKSLLTEIRACQALRVSHTPPKLVYLKLCVNL